MVTAVGELITAQSGIILKYDISCGVYVDSQFAGTGTRGQFISGGFFYGKNLGNIVYFKFFPCKFLYSKNQPMPDLFCLFRFQNIAVPGTTNEKTSFERFYSVINFCCKLVTILFRCYRRVRKILLDLSANRAVIAREQWPKNIDPSIVLFTVFYTEQQMISVQLKMYVSTGVNIIIGSG